MSRQWQLAGPAFPVYDEFGNITHTTVSVVSTNESYATYTEILLGDQTTKDASTLIKMAKDQYFKAEYADYAMEDSIKKVDELDRAIKDAKKFQDDVKELIEDIKTDAENNTRGLQSAERQRNIVFSELVSKINGYDNRFEEMNNVINGFFAEILSMLEGSDQPPEGEPLDGTAS